jgi:hypothetical protein
MPIRIVTCAQKRLRHEIVMGAHGLGSDSEIPLDSVATHVIHLSSLPGLIIK